MTPKPITATGNRSKRRYWIGSNRRYDRYNRSLVNRIEDLMDPSFLMNWRNLLADNNRGKRGHPYRTPNAFITFLAKLRAVYNVPFRSLEGIARIFARITGITAVCYTSIFRRIRKIVPNLESHDGKPVDCAIDSTGFKITIRGDYPGSLSIINRFLPFLFRCPPDLPGYSCPSRRSPAPCGCIHHIPCKVTCNIQCTFQIT